MLHGAATSAAGSGEAKPELWPTSDDGVRPRWSPGLPLEDFSRSISSEVALVCRAGHDGRASLVCAWGVDSERMVGVNRGGGRQWGGRWGAGGFVGRALGSGRATFEPLHSGRDAELVRAAGGAPLTHAVAAPIRVPGGVWGILVAGFRSRPPDTTQVLWIADCFAGLIALLVHRPASLAGLLDSRRRDGLTGCLTYDDTLRELTREINRSSRSGLELSVCFLDLDGFKRVNDRHGHLHGNRVLAEVGQILRAGVRSCDTIGRYGGDEFVAVLPETGEAEAMRLAERLGVSIARGAAARLGEHLTASIGVAGWLPGSSAQELLARADSALYASKRAEAPVSRRDSAARGGEATGDHRP